MVFTLASASEVVHVWDVASSSSGGSAGSGGDAPLPALITPTHPTTILRPHGATGTFALQWNHNNSVLASSGGDGAIALSGVGDGKLILRLGGASPSSGRVNALGFSSGSRYLVSGGWSGLSLWDLKHPERAARKLPGHTGEVRALALGAGDALVASCGDAGEILLHSLAQASLTAKLASDGLELEDIQFSPHKTHLLASAGNAGVVQVWDTQSASVSATLRPSASVTGSSDSRLSALRFSTTSPNLLASVGHRRLCFYDLSNGKCIRAIATDEVLTSLDYHFDGCSLALGTLEGHVLMYDIRAATKPTARILAHPGQQVNAVKFQHAVAGRKNTTPTHTAPASAPHDRATPPVAAAAQHTTSASSAATNNTHHSIQTAPPSSVANTDFSPLRAGAPKTASPSATNTAGGSVSTRAFTSPAARSAGFAADPSLMLTPLEERPSASTAAAAAQHKPLQHTQPPAHLISSFTRPAAGLPSQQSHPAHLSLSPGHHLGAPKSTFTADAPSPARDSAAPASAPASAQPPVEQQQLTAISSPPRRINYSASPSPLASSPLPASSSTSTSAASGAGLNDYQVSLLRSMLDESLYSMRTEMRAQVSDLHVEMLRQFHGAQLAQTRQMDQLVERFTHLVDEVKELREDYKALKHIY